MTNQPTILIAEDSADIREILLRLLQRSGYHVIAVTNGQDALAQCQRQLPDLVLLDLSMPLLNGWDTLAAIRQLPGGAATRIVAVTAHAMHQDREAVFAQGFDGYVAKPLEFRSFLALVAEMLARGTGQLS